MSRSDQELPIVGDPRIGLAAGAPVDLTLRVAGFQIEEGAYASDLILPPPGEIGISTRRGPAHPMGLRQAVA